MSNDIDRDAELIGIDQKVWEGFKKTFKYEQMEFESIVGPIDDKEAFERHKQAMAQRWFGYYKKCKIKRNTIIDQYNRIALMGKER